MKHKTILALVVGLVVFVGGPSAFSPAQAFGQGRSQGIGWCTRCGQDRPLSHDFTHGSGGSSGGSAYSFLSAMSYDERLEWLGQSNYIYRGMISGPISVFTLPITIPIGCLGVVGGKDPAYLPYVMKNVVVSTEPYWILPYYAMHVPYYFGKGAWSYFSMDLFEEDASGYSKKVSKAVSEAKQRQRKTQSEFVRWKPESKESREKRIQKRLAEARQQAEKERKHSQLRRIYSGIRKTQMKLDSPEARIRMLGPKLDFIDEAAVRVVRSGKLHGSMKDDILFGAFDLGTSAFGLPGELVKRAGHALVGTIDTGRDLVYLETSSIESRAARNKSVHHILKSTRNIKDPVERKKAIQKILSEAAPLLTRSAADAGKTGWSVFQDAVTRRANWEVVAPELRKRIQAVGAGMIVGVGVGKVVGKIPILKNWPDLEKAVAKRAGSSQFYRALGKGAVSETASAVSEKGASKIIDWVDGVVDRVQGEGP